MLIQADLFHHKSIGVKMKIISVLLMILVLFIQNSYGNELNFRNNIIITNQNYPKDLNKKFDKLVFGLDEQATNYLDTALGELELFPSHPPSGLHAVFEIPEKNNQGIIWSYTDIRPISDEERFEVTFTINLQKDVFDTLRFRWQKLPIEFLDSAILSDNILGTLFRINMLEVQEAVNTNIGLSKFLIKLWVNKQKVYVEDNLQSILNELQVNPNPVNDILRLNIDKFSYRIYNTKGELMMFGISEIPMINVSELTNGLYYLVIDRELKRYRIDFIKL